MKRMFSVSIIELYNQCSFNLLLTEPLASTVGLSAVDGLDIEDIGGVSAIDFSLNSLATVNIKYNHVRTDV